MKPSRRKPSSAALTLIEVTLVVAVFLGLIGVALTDATSPMGWSHRSMRPLSISQVGKDARAYTRLGMIPAAGTAFLTCGQSATKNHAPTTTGW